jgi:hypothetical protein
LAGLGKKSCPGKRNPGQMAGALIRPVSYLYKWVWPDSPRPGYNFTGQHILSHGCEMNYTEITLLIYDKFVIRI